MCRVCKHISVVMHVMRVVAGTHLIAQLLSLTVVLPEGLLVFLQGTTVKVVLLPILQRPLPVCYDLKVWPGLLCAALLLSCNTQDLVWTRYETSSFPSRSFFTLQSGLATTRDGMEQQMLLETPRSPGNTRVGEGIWLEGTLPCRRRRKAESASCKLNTECSDVREDQPDMNTQLAAISPRTTDRLLLLCTASPAGLCSIFISTRISLSRCSICSTVTAGPQPLTITAHDIEDLSKCHGRPQGGQAASSGNLPELVICRSSNVVRCQVKHLALQT